MSSPELLSDLLRRHGVENDELLDALKLKFKKIRTEKEMAIRKGNKLRAQLHERDQLRAKLSAVQLEYGSVLTDRNRLREVLNKLVNAGDTK